MNEKYSLYIIATPIGNLKDITLRALECLQDVDFVLCEDTRQTVKLLNHYNIHKKLIAYHKFNEFNASDKIVELLLDGSSAALVSDAGTPLISDPGNTLVTKLVENGIKFCVIPGANALLPAVIMSGFDTSAFTFRGFLPTKKNEAVKIIKEAIASGITNIFYVSPHALKDVLKLMTDICPENKLSLSKEITKLYETTYRGTAKEILDSLAEEIKGEYTLVLDKSDIAEDKAVYTEEELAEMFESLCLKGGTKKDALRELCRLTNLPKNYLYDLLMKS